MLFYKTIYTPAASTVEMCKWGSSQTDASKTRAQLKRDGFKVVGTQTVDIPTGKGGLLDWLNANVTS
jgi:hypothetical protein